MRQSVCSAKIQEIVLNMQAHTIEKIDGHQNALGPIVK